MRAKDFLTEMPLVSDLNKGFERMPQADPDFVEHHEIKQWAAIIKKECAPFINENYNALQQGMFLYRGVKGADATADMVIQGTVRQDRRPRDTSKFWHDLIDQYFQTNFNYPYRSGSVFASTNDSEVSDYGTPYTLWPAGDYLICFSPKITDMTVDLTQHFSHTYTQFLRKMSDAAIRETGVAYKLDWVTRDDVSDQFQRFFEAISNNMHLSTEDFTFVQRFKVFLLKYFLPRMNYDETTKFTDLGDSEGMIRCNKYYGVLHPTRYGSRANLRGIQTMLELILS